MKLSTKKISAILSANLVGDDINCEDVSIDTRTIVKNNLFIALKGEQFDGHDYVAQAEKNGASAVIVDRKVNCAIPQIIVQNTLNALQQLALYWRNQFHLPFVAITGSCGKTTTRHLVASILQQKAYTLSSEKSFNNHIGVPLTLLKLNDAHRFAVIEIGASALGEVDALVQLVKPMISLITMAGEAHLEGFGGIKGVAKGKGEIYKHIQPNGVAIINKDDYFFDYWRTLVPSRNTVMTFSVKNKADVFAFDVRQTEEGNTHFELHVRDQTASVHLPLMGQHNVANAVAAAAAATALGVKLETIVSGLEAISPVDRRLVKTRGYAGATIIDDSYNANPSSVSAAIDVLTASSGKSVLVLGDMMELGKDKVEWHKKIGKRAQQSGVNLLFCFGELTKNTVEQFGSNAFHFMNRDDLVEALKQYLDDDTTVMIKGSNSMKMNEVTQVLCQK